MRHKGEPRGATRFVSETRSPRDEFIERLAYLGATPDEIEAVRQNWDNPDWDNRDEVIRFSDAELRADLVELRKEYELSTKTDEEIADAALAEARREAFTRKDASVAALVAWVGDDESRAQAVLELEGERPVPRTTLIAQLDPVARGASG